MKYAMAFVLLGFAALPSHAEDPWEPSDIHTVGVSTPARTQPDAHLVEAAALDLIRFYQKDISSKTISRCPFQVSCSNFAARVIADRGIVPGLVMFIDRFYYRENAAAFGYYRLVVTAGIWKIDDGEYLD